MFEVGADLRWFADSPASPDDRRDNSSSAQMNADRDSAGRSGLRVTANLHATNWPTRPASTCGRPRTVTQEGSVQRSRARRRRTPFSAAATDHHRPAHTGDRHTLLGACAVLIRRRGSLMVSPQDA